MVSVRNVEPTVSFAHAWRATTTFQTMMTIPDGIKRGRLSSPCRDRETSHIEIDGRHDQKFDIDYSSY